MGTRIAAELKNKILLPVLGDSYGATLEKGDIKLAFDPKNGALFAQYFDRRFPIAPSDYAFVLERAFGELAPSDVEMMCGVLLSPQIKSQLADLCSKNMAVTTAVENAVRSFAVANNVDQLHELLERQHYRLASWRVGPEEINYRRFFAINDLAALVMERPEVFEAAHSFILPRLAAGDIAGVRVDHPDGLSDPLQYFQRLQSHFLLACARKQFGGDAPAWDEARSTLLAEFERPIAAGQIKPWPLYVVIEKILALGEPLPAPWPQDGTSGYDFLIMANGLFVNADAEAVMTKTYHELIGSQESYADLVYKNKKMVLRELLPSELHRLTAMLDRIAQRNRMTRDFTSAGLERALSEVIATFSVYRTYITSADISAADRAAIRTAIDAAIARNPSTPRDVFDFIESTLLQKSFAGATDADRAASRKFAEKFQQLTAPTMAKGIEDTTFYQYQRLISLNEVGGDPSKFGISSNELHAYFADRQKHWPHALSTLSTHDTKRSEDVRARISVLADVPDQWRAAVMEWSRLNAPLRRETAGGPSPARDEEYCYYQTLLGAWPLEAEDVVAGAVFIERIQSFMFKANREASVRTSWSSPNKPHEAAVASFVEATLDPQRSPQFLASFINFQKKIAYFGRLTSLAQTVLKLTAPGAPDTYQGTEMWDLSLVDPDNRRPVDYARRATELREIASAEATTLFADSRNGRAKLFLHQRILNLRKRYPGLFSSGDYRPLMVHGAAWKHVFSFARSNHQITAVVVVAKNLAKLARFDPQQALGASLWQDTTLEMPVRSKQWRNVFTDVKASLDENATVAELLGGLPVALWISERST